MDELKIVKRDPLDLEYWKILKTGLYHVDSGRTATDFRTVIGDYTKYGDLHCFR